jgi:hypothetical protein
MQLPAIYALVCRHGPDVEEAIIRSVNGYGQVHTFSSFVPLLLPMLYCRTKVVLR